MAALTALTQKMEPARPAATGSAPAVIAWLVEAAEAIGDGTLERSGDPLRYTWTWPDGSAVSLTIEHTDAATAGGVQARQRKVDERHADRLAQLDRLDPLYQAMLGDLARGATHRQLADWYGFKRTTVSYYVRVIRIQLGLLDLPPFAFRLELRRYARYLPALCDR